MKTVPDDHVSLTVRPPTVAERRAGRPRVVLHFHLADAALRASRGLVRPEHGEAMASGSAAGVAGRDRVRGHGPAHLAAGRGGAGRCVRDPAAAPGRGAAAGSGRCLPLRFLHLRDDGSGPHPVLRVDGRTADRRVRPVLAGLGPMSRHHHRVVTHGRWRKVQPSPGQFVFRSPSGRVFLVTGNGTLPLGTTDFAHRVWRAADRAIHLTNEALVG